MKGCEKYIKNFHSENLINLHIYCHVVVMKHYNIRVLGHVQGVGFRYAARRTAELYNVYGFVRNEPDGTVYIEAEGETLNLDMYLEWCRKGPGYGRVEKVFHTASTVQGFQRFEIRI